MPLLRRCLFSIFLFFFFNDTATTEIYTLSLHDALPIFPGARPDLGRALGQHDAGAGQLRERDRKSTRLNSSHANISYAVFCLKKKKYNKQKNIITQNRLQDLTY